MNKKLLLFSVPLIMLIFFARNIYLVENENMDSWMGGGMRMFGEIDKMLYRVSGFNVEYNNEDYFVNLRSIPELEDEDVKIRILPSEKRLKAVLSSIKSKSWYFDENTKTIQLGKSENDQYNILKKNITGVKVYKIRFNDASKEINLELINELSDEQI